jgi:hypothetical protein
LYRCQSFRKEYEICEKTSDGDNYKANSNPGNFGKGLISNNGDQFRTARVGLLGEMAFAKINLITGRY